MCVCVCVCVCVCKSVPFAKFLNIIIFILHEGSDLALTYIVCLRVAYFPFYMYSHMYCIYCPTHSCLLKIINGESAMANVMDL